MKTITEREDGTHKVTITFPANEPASRNRTKQEFYKDANINYIMKKYRKTGILGDPLNYKIGEYGDFTSGNDFFETMRKVTNVKNIFGKLPAHIKTKFNNEPQNLIEFLTKEENNEEAYNMGLKTRPPVPAPVPPDTPPVTPPVNP